MTRYLQQIRFRNKREKKKFDTKFEFLNIELDNEIMKIRFFSIKLTKAMKFVNETFIENFFTHRQIDFFVNFLFFCAKIVIFERFFFIFLYRIRDHIRNVNKLCKFNEIMRANLRWWQTFLSRWNDIKMLRKIFSRSSNHIWTNVSNNWNINDFWFRVFNDKSFENFNWRYSTRFRNRQLNIQIKKMRTILHALRQ